MNQIEDGIMVKDTESTKLTDYGKERNKKISKLRHIVERYLGISHLHSDAFRVKIPWLIKNTIDAMFRQMTFNLFRRTKILEGVCGGFCTETENKQISYYLNFAQNAMQINL